MPALARPQDCLCSAEHWLFLPELQPQSESVISTRSFKINTGLHFSFHLFIVVLSAAGWKQIVGGTLTHLGAGK